MSKKVLLIHPSYRTFYENLTIKAGTIYTPPLNLAAIAGALIRAGCAVEILDCNVERSVDKALYSRLKRMEPEIVGLTFHTPLFKEAARLTRLAKAWLEDVTVVAGGAHATACPEDILEHSEIDIAVMGEGDESVVEIAADGPRSQIEGIAYKNSDGEVVINPPRGKIRDLDTLAFPAWSLYDLRKYKTTELLTRANPAGWIETSRGCVFQCVYCNKRVHGISFRVKSPERVVDEMECMLNYGFRELHISDDGFTTNMARAAEICDEIIRRGLKFPWATVTGIRADRVDLELLRKMRRAGCYQVCYGIESGNQGILDRCRKRETLEDVRRAVRDAKRAGLEVFGYFMLALPGETEETMQDTIRFAKELDLDMAKVSITIPFPGTEQFDDLERKGLIKTKDWSFYNAYVPAQAIYDHPSVDWDTVDRYFRKFYRSFYWRPKFVFRRILNDVTRGTLASDVRYFVQTKW